MMRRGKSSQKGCIYPPKTFLIFTLLAVFSSEETSMATVGAPLTKAQQLQQQQHFQQHATAAMVQMMQQNPHMMMMNYHLMVQQQLMMEGNRVNNFSYSTDPNPPPSLPDQPMPSPSSSLLPPMISTLPPLSSSTTTHTEGSTDATKVSSEQPQSAKATVVDDETSSSSDGVLYLPLPPTSASSSVHDLPIVPQPHHPPTPVSSSYHHPDYYYPPAFDPDASETGGGGGGNGNTTSSSTGSGAVGGMAGMPMYAMAPVQSPIVGGGGVDGSLIPLMPVPPMPFAMPVPYHPSSYAAMSAAAAAAAAQSGGMLPTGYPLPHMMSHLGGGGYPGMEHQRYKRRRVSERHSTRGVSGDGSEDEDDEFNVPKEYKCPNPDCTKVITKKKKHKGEKVDRCILSISLFFV